MKRLFTMLTAVMLCLLASAQVKELGDAMTVSNRGAWDEFRARMKKIHRKRPVVALVLGGGGAKGTAHVGVLKYLEEIDMPVDMVLGTSMGGLIGSLFSLGYTTDQIDTLISGMDWPIMMSDKIPDEFITYQKRKYKEKYALSIPFDFENGHFKRSMPSAYITGQNVGNLINSLTVGYSDNMRFCDLPIPFACVATDLIEGKGLVWVNGSLGEALRTTMSIPVVFAPIRKNGRFLVDGGMMDNFPADVAKALGADIVIGVSVDSPSIKYDDAYNLMDVVSLTIDLSGKTRLEETLKIPDVLLKPDLEGLTSLSFSEDNVRKLINNGYKEAFAHSEALAALKNRIGHKHSLERHAPAAKSLMTDDVKISDIVFSGITDKEKEVLLEKFDIAQHDLINKAILDDNVARMFATNTFRNVSYKLLGKGPEYVLQLNCEKGPLHKFGLGVRFDTEEMVSAAINVGFFAHSLYGSRVDCDLKLSANPYARLEYSFNLPHFPRFAVSADLRYISTSLMSFADSPFSMKSFSSRQEIYFTDFQWNKFDLSAGLRNSAVRVGECSEITANPELVGKYTNHTGLFVRGEMDNMKGGSYFPTQGSQINLEYSWQFQSNMKDYGDFAAYNYHAITFDSRTAVTPADYFTFIFSSNLRWLLSPDLENIPFYFRNIVGGDMPGRYVPHQKAFNCINNAYCLGNAMLLLGTGFRFKVYEKQYLALQPQLALHNDKLWGPYDVSSAAAFFDRHSVYGCALEYSMETVVGPIKANLHWSSLNKGSRTGGIGLYVSAGFYF